MEPRIPAGSYCVFRGEPGGGPLAGTRQGKIVLAVLRDAADPEDGGAYTVKVYRRIGAVPEAEDRASQVQLESINPTYAPIVLGAADDVDVVAEFVRLAGPS